MRLPKPISLTEYAVSAAIHVQDRPYEDHLWFVKIQLDDLVGDHLTPQEKSGNMSWQTRDIYKTARGKLQYINRNLNSKKYQGRTVRKNVIEFEQKCWTQIAYLTHSIPVSITKIIHLLTSITIALLHENCVEGSHGKMPKPDFVSLKTSRPIYFDGLRHAFLNKSNRRL